MVSERRLFISFSCGETSALMLATILFGWRDRYDDIKVVFANTGQENEETLVFVDKVARLWNIDIVWVEAVVHPGVRKAPTHRIVTFETADRTGRPFEDHIAKYGIPNYKFKDCTRGLKLRPIESYLRSVGWEVGSYDSAVGIRADEADRMSSQAKSRRLKYPLLSEFPTSKPMVNTFWQAQPFRLELKGYQGNCKWCWKKSFRKHITLILEDPAVYDFPRRMEATYGLVGAEFQKTPEQQLKPLPAGYRRVFFRGNVDTAGLFEMAANRKGAFVPAPDDANVYLDFDANLDVGGGCEESCEVFADEDQLDLFGEAA